VICQHSTPISEHANACRLGMYGGYPSNGVCSGCMGRGENTEEFASSAKSHEQPVPTTPRPSKLEMGANLVRSLKNWASGGFAIASADLVASRLSICQQCPEWDQAGFAGTGKCTKCGCSGAKLHMATSKCPIDKWGPVTPSVE
jgi:hypothetical protein